MLCNEVPLILRREIYATAAVDLAPQDQGYLIAEHVAVAGAIVFVLLTNARMAVPP